MQPAMPERYPNWRQVYAALTQAPQHRSDDGAADELLAIALSRLEAQTLQVLAARDRNYRAVKAYVEQPGRMPDHQTYMENSGAAGIRTFTQHSQGLYEWAVQGVIKVLRDAATRPVIISKPPEPPRRRLRGR
jgi:hypothetical protein